jgi:hypothetical protein
VTKSVNVIPFYFNVLDRMKSVARLLELGDGRRTVLPLTLPYKVLSHNETLWRSTRTSDHSHVSCPFAVENNSAWLDAV